MLSEPERHILSLIGDRREAVVDSRRGIVHFKAVSLPNGSHD
jgi:hypothetical protein